MDDSSDKKMPEEFNNFMHRVTEVNEIVKKMTSSSKDLQNIGILEADRLLNDSSEKILENVNEEDVILKVKSNRTVLNRRAIDEKEKKDEETMSQEAFMAEVSKDADKRYKDRQVRTEKMETFKKQATKAFRRGDYEKALSCYNKAIEQIRDSPLLYNNRCLTFINLKFYKFAIDDAKMALRLNETCLRSFLFLAKACLLDGDREGYKEAIDKAKENSPVNLDFINDFEQKLTVDKQDCEYEHDFDLKTLL